MALVDDLGDFLSSDLPPPVNPPVDLGDLFAVLSNSPRSLHIPPPSSAGSNPPLPNFALHLHNAETSDLVFIVGEQKFVGHKEILCSRSPYFARQLSQVVHLVGMDMEIEIRDCSPPIFAKILEFIYTGKVEITHEDVWALYQKAETYELLQLAKFCTDFILSVVDSNNVWQIYGMAVEMGAEQIAEKCEQFARSLVPHSTLGLPVITPPPPSLHSNPPVPLQQQTPTQPQQQQPQALPQTQPLPPTGLSTSAPPTAGFANANATQPPRGPNANSPQQLIKTEPGISDERRSSYVNHINVTTNASLKNSQGISKTKTRSRSSHCGSPAAVKDLLMPSLEPVRPSTLEWALEHLNVLTNMVRVLLDADRISVFLYNEESNELCALLNTSCEIRIPSNLGIAGSVFSTGKLINSRDPYNDTRFLVDVDKQTGYKTTSLLCMPIPMSGGRIGGVIEVLNKQNNLKDTPTDSHAFFEKNDEITLDHVCRLCGNLLERIPEYIHSRQVRFDQQSHQVHHPQHPPPHHIQAQHMQQLQAQHQLLQKQQQHQQHHTSHSPQQRSNSLQPSPQPHMHYSPHSPHPAAVSPAQQHAQHLAPHAPAPAAAAAPQYSPQPTTHAAAASHVNAQFPMYTQSRFKRNTDTGAPSTYKKSKRNSIPIFHFKLPNGR